MRSPRAMTRRELLLGATGVAAAMAFTPSLLTAPPAAATVDIYVVTVSTLRLRSGPGLNYSIVANLPKGTTMEIIDSGAVADGYTWVKVWVSSIDKTGYVASEYIAKQTDGGSLFPAGTTVHVDTGGGAANLRSTPAIANNVIRTIPNGTTGTSQGGDTVASGYTWIKVTLDGTTGWMASILLAAGAGTPVITGSHKTTANVNLRSGAGTGYTVLRVVAAGSIVQSSDTVTNGFRFVVHQGLAGWMADAYLVPASGTGPVPDYQTTTANLNLRKEPSLTAAILLVIPAGSKVVPTGEAAYGFAKVTYAGTTGWAYMDYLV
jgi:uncharacterized protein YraI